MPFQYAAKLVCGVSKEFVPVANGHYATTINIHNPGKEAKFRYKLAVADPAKDGKIHPFRDGQIGPDGAQYFDCRVIRGIFNVGGSALLDGFFVIESEAPLDVVAVYTTNDFDGKGVPAIDVERVFERKIG
jgi:hypothetical protein